MRAAEASCFFSLPACESSSCRSEAWCIWLLAHFDLQERESVKCVLKYRHTRAQKKKNQEIHSKYQWQVRENLQAIPHPDNPGVLHWSSAFLNLWFCIEWLDYFTLKTNNLAAVHLCTCVSVAQRTVLSFGSQWSPSLRQNGKANRRSALGLELDANQKVCLRIL